MLECQNAYNEPISFLRFLNTLTKVKTKKFQRTARIWFHNINYDFRIIIHELFYNNFIHIVDSENMSYYADLKTEGSRAFSIVGRNLSQYIGINLYYKGWKFMIRDSMSILNSAQDSILKAFGYPEKVPINWELINPFNLKANIERIKKRNIYDVESLARCLEEFKTVFYEKYKGRGNTAAGMSLDALQGYLCNAVDEEPTRENKLKVFRAYYPQQTGFPHEISRMCYNGGICTVNNNHKGKILKDLQMIDINSSYPYSMTKPLPFGDPEHITDFCNAGYSEYMVYVDFKIPGVPFQRCHTENMVRRYIGEPEKPDIYKRSEFPQKFAGYIAINSIDLETLKHHANIKNLQFITGVNYQTTDLIKEFIYPIYEEKARSKGVAKQADKLLLNSLYGKFAQDLSGIVFIYDDLDTYQKVVAVDENTLYKPLASAVTAYSRQLLVDTYNLIGNSFIYCDTDSIYFKDVEKCTEIFNNAGLIDPDALGKWAFDPEYGDRITRGIFLSKKNYLIEIRDHLKLTCVGLPQRYHEQINFENFRMNSQPFEIMKMKNIHGGKAPRFAPFVIKERSYRG